ncbi:MAG: type 4a pilus biogenesis protein PilO [Cellvibrio sp.]|nr:type 4a pilus biogenesis protein PilO [Cellvibrio sp.]
MSFETTWQQIKDFDLSDIDFNRAGVWPLPGKVFVCLLILFCILLGAYYVWVMGLKEELLSVESKEISLKKTFEEKSYEAANLDAYKLQMEEMRATFDKLLSRLPQKTEIAGLLEDIGAKGRESGLVINNLGIQSEVVSDYYIEVPIGIEVKGGYHDLGGFVSGVASLPRIVTLHDFSINRPNKGLSLQMNILAKTYRYKAIESASQNVKKGKGRTRK